MVGGLVQDVEIWAERQTDTPPSVTSTPTSTCTPSKLWPSHSLPRHGHLREGHPALLPPRQAGHRPGGQLPGDPVAAQLVAVLLLVSTCRANKQQQIENVQTSTGSSQGSSGGRAYVPGNLFSRSSTEQTLRSSWSTWCWLK